ncbi:MAG: DUF2235 domain-containing protein [Pseudomonadota bacterium]
MAFRSLFKRLYQALNLGSSRRQQGFSDRRGRQTHVIILDGTMSTLKPGCESNAGLTYKLLEEADDRSVSLYYEAGLQWQDWRSTRDVIAGRGINRQIRRAYGYLASRYHPGDRIVLLGYSRGAFAVRSLAGVIDRVGLLRASEATERNVATAYRHYQAEKITPSSEDFARATCHADVEIEIVGVWDTVKALGIVMPVLWRLSVQAHAFHDHQLSDSVRHGYHALALNENRVAYNAVMWEVPDTFDGRVEQVWFRGNHADVGGNLRGFHAARPLSNIPLVWMLDKLSEHGVALPEGWRVRFPMDVTSPSTGNWQGWTKLFITRRRRRVLLDPSEKVHPSVQSFQEMGLRGDPVTDHVP